MAKDRSLGKRAKDAVAGAAVYGAKGARMGANIHPIGAVAGAKIGAVAGAIRGAVDDDWADGGITQSAGSEANSRKDDIDF